MPDAPRVPTAVFDAIADLAATPDGWWRTSGREAYEELAVTLLAFGLGEDTVIDILTRAYAAAAAEFGG